MASGLNSVDRALVRLTDIFEQSMIASQDDASARLAKALRLLQEREDGLTIDQKVKMGHLHGNELHCGT